MSAAVTVRPTTWDPPRPWSRWATRLATAVAVVLVAAVALAWVQDRDGGYPGYRDPVSLQSLQVVVNPATNSAVDVFDGRGTLGRIGPWRWAAAVGPLWRPAESFVGAGPSGGVVVVDPKAADLVTQVDVFRPVAGAGLVFRWRSAADHFSAEVAPGLSAWLLVRTVGGHRTELGRVAASTPGSNVGVSVAGDHLVMAVDGQPKLEVDDHALAGGGAVGLTAPDGRTRFDTFAVLPT